MTGVRGEPASKAAEGNVLLLTRSREQNRRLLDALAQQGLESVLAIERPLLEVETHDPSPAERRLILELDQFDHVIFVSQNAAAFGAAALAEYWPQWPLALQWYAVGSATAAALAAEAISCSVPGDYSSEGLLALPALQSVAGQRVLIVRGADGGREILKQTLLDRGARVDYLEVYRRRWHDYPEGLRVAPEGGQPLVPGMVRVVVVYSGEALKRLAELMDWPAAAQVLIVPSRRIADMAKDLGFAKVEVAMPSDSAMALQIARHWSGATPEQG